MTRRLAPALALLAACSSEPAATPSDASAPRDATPDAPPVDAPGPKFTELPAVDAPSSVRVEDGVLRELLLIDAPSPPANPTTGARTPAALDHAIVLRYRTDAPSPVAVRAVFVAMPGFLGGAGSFDPLARALVRLGARGGVPVEVWAVDRRSNQLEDLRGMWAAERARDPEVASAFYYDQSVRVGGAAFDGFLEPASMDRSYMSEWGLATTIRDLRAVIERIPSPRSHVVLMGHSLGATIAEAYAAWDFDGAPGYRSLAALALIDGVAGGRGVTEEVYRNGGQSGIPGLSVPGITPLRSGGPWFVSLPVIGVQALATSQIVAMRAQTSPDAVLRDGVRDRTLRLLLGVAAVPPLTNRAALGLSFDDASCPLTIASMSCGAPSGGALRMVANAFSPGSQLTVPASATDTYRWSDATEVTPREFTSLRSVANVWTATPSNFAEWYFPSRLGADQGALGDMRLAADSWQVREGIRAMHGGDIDVPVLAVAAALTSSPGTYDGVRARIAQTVGADLPAAGAARTEPRAFSLLTVPGMTHIDPLTADADHPQNPIPMNLLSLVESSTRGTVTVP